MSHNNIEISQPARTKGIPDSLESLPKSLFPSRSSAQNRLPTKRQKRGLLLKGVLCLFTLFLWMTPSWGEDLSVSLQEKGEGIYVLDGAFLVKAPREIVWNVLTDYNHINQFVSSISSSHIKEIRSDHLLVEQEMAAHLLFWERKVSVLLKVEETPFEKIRFEDISKKDFTFNVGYWKIEEKRPGESYIQYHLKMKSNFEVPPIISKGLLEKNIKKLLKELRREMIRRSNNPN